MQGALIEVLKIPMLSFFFNRHSKTVRVMEFAGIVLMAIAGMRAIACGKTIPIAIFSLIALEYAFIRICSSRRWYANAPRESGIELQFIKAIVPTSYILVVMGIAAIILPPAIPLAIAALLIAVVAHVNIILLYFHRRDRDPTPVNYFSNGTFLE
jgi:hypothetical protein